jgi:hypothetical protein
MTELATLPRLEQYLELVKDACPGDCNKPFWRAHKPALDELQMQYTTRDEPVAYEPDQDLIRSAVTALQLAAPHWCRECQNDIGAAVQDLPDLAYDYARMPGGRLAPPPPSEIHAKAVAPPSPSPAYDGWEAIGHWLADWAGEIADAIGEPRPYTFRARILVLQHDRHATWLGGRWSAVMAYFDAPRFGREAMSEHRRGLLATGADELEHRLPMACLGCDRKALYRKDGSEIVECRFCHRRWKRDDYERLGVAYRDSDASHLPVLERPRLGHSIEGYGGAA